MTKRLSDDEKRYFTDQISVLQGENERLTKCVEDLQEEKDALKEYFEASQVVAHGFHTGNEVLDIRCYDSAVQRMQEATDALLTGEEDE